MTRRLIAATVITTVLSGAAASASTAPLSKREAQTFLMQTFPPAMESVERSRVRRTSVHCHQWEASSPLTAM